MLIPFKSPRFGITTLLLLTALIAMGLGWWQDWHRRQQGLYLHVLMPSVYQDGERLPPESIAVTAIVPNQDFYADQTIYRSVKGKLSVSPTGQYYLKIDGNFRSGFNYDGQIELETLTQPTGFGFSGALYAYVFAISESEDPAVLLEQLVILDATVAEPAEK